MTDDGHSVADGQPDRMDDLLRQSLDHSTQGVGEVSSRELRVQLSRRLAQIGTDPAIGFPDDAPDGNSNDDGFSAHGREATHMGVGPTLSRLNQRRMLVMAAAFLVIAGVVGAYVLVGRDGGLDVRNVATGPERTGGFDDWSPGWHELDRGPVPGFASASLEWFDGHLVVAGGLWVSDGPESGSSTWITSQWSYDPGQRTWSELRAAPFEIGAMVVSGGVLVAVGFPPDQGHLSWAERDYHWATLAGIDQRWSDHGVVDGLFGEDMRRYARKSLEGANILVDTGENVIDFSLGSVLDPAAGRSVALGPSELADVPPNSYLPPRIEPVPIRVAKTSRLSVAWPPLPTEDGDPSRAAFTGDMLIWDAAGKRVDRVSVESSETVELDDPLSGTGEETGEIDSFPPDRWSTATVDGRVLVIGVEGSAIGSAYSIDPVSGIAEPIASIGEMIGSSSMDGRDPCYFAETAANGDVLAMPCATDWADTGPLLMRDGRWSAVASLPAEVAGAAQVRTWLMMEPAGNAMVVWSTMDRPERADVVYIPEASRPWAAVWVPGSVDGGPHTTHPARPADTRATAEQVEESESCTVDDLPDISFALDDRFTSEPRAGVGGLGDDQGPDGASPGTSAMCSRYWIAKDDPGVHITQYRGEPPGVAPVSGEPFGPFRVYAIHEGFVIDYRPTQARAAWSLVAYGLDQDEVNAIAANLESG